MSWESVATLALSAIVSAVVSLLMAPLAYWARRIGPPQRLRGRGLRGGHRFPLEPSRYIPWRGDPFPGPSELLIAMAGSGA